MTNLKTALSILAATAAIGILSVDTADARKLFASRAKVRAACEAQGGSGWGLSNGSGSYGCVTRSGWIDCDDNGACEGGRRPGASRRAARRSSRLPGARN